jgi:hypothetical protein
MWLPETAVDLDTLSVLAKNGILFTILAPWQIENLEGEPGLPARVNLPDGESIIVFPYHSELSTRISFESASTTNADHFCDRIRGNELEGRSSLLLLASDGELYGHHQPFRDKFLAHLLDGASSSRGIEPTYPGRWLQDHPVTNVARIRENTSWSCSHGIDRWREACGCSANSGWKSAFYAGLKTLARAIDNSYDNYCQQLGMDSWTVLEDFLEIELGLQDFDVWIVDKKPIFDGRISNKQLQLLLMAEMDRHRMFASCGWFFGDLQRIEPQNALKYAAHASWLVYEATGNDLSGTVCGLLDESISPYSSHSAGDTYREYLQKMVELKRSY